MHLPYKDPEIYYSSRRTDLSASLFLSRLILTNYGRASCKMVEIRLSERNAYAMKWVISLRSRRSFVKIRGLGYLGFVDFFVKSKTNLSPSRKTHPSLLCQRQNHAKSNMGKTTTERQYFHHMTLGNFGDQMKEIAVGATPSGIFFVSRAASN